MLAFPAPMFSRRHVFNIRSINRQELVIWMLLALSSNNVDAMSKPPDSTALIAISSNFTECFHKLKSSFESETSYRLQASSGSTGKLYAQILNQAPFDALLAADQESVQRLVEQELALANTRFTYAEGRLVLWSAGPTLASLANEPLARVLNNDRLTGLAIANHRLAPYGRASQQVIEALGINSQAKIVTGENISQTYQFVHSRNIEIGFVALAQLIDKRPKGYTWAVDPAFHTAIKQDAVLLRRGSDNPAARQLIIFLNSKTARQTIKACGYDTPS